MALPPDNHDGCLKLKEQCGHLTAAARYELLSQVSTLTPHHREPIVNRPGQRPSG